MYLFGVCFENEFLEYMPFTVKIAESLFYIYFYVADCFSLFLLLETGQHCYVFKIGVEKCILKLIILFHHQYKLSLDPALDVTESNTAI